MQTYDLLMLLVLVGATLFGFWKGMAWQIASLASLAVSYVAALRFSEQLAPVFGDHAPWNRFVAMLAIYIGSSFVIWTLFRFISGAIDRVRLESFDKQLGAMFGLAKGVALCVVITFFAVSLLPQAQGEAIVGSQSGRYIVALLDKSHSVFPPEVHQVVDPYLHKIEQRLNPNHQPHGPNTQQSWPSQAKANTPTGWPQIQWPQSQSAQQQPQQQPGWPSASPSQPVWPSTTQAQTAWPSPQQPPIDWRSQSPRQADNRDPYGIPREPQPFPGPYSAEVPASGDY